MEIKDIEQTERQAAELLSDAEQYHERMKVSVNRLVENIQKKQVRIINPAQKNSIINEVKFEYGQLHNIIREFTNKLLLIGIKSVAVLGEIKDEN